VPVWETECAFKWLDVVYQERDLGLPSLKTCAPIFVSAILGGLSFPTTDGKVKGHDGHKSGPELSVGYGFGKAPKGKVEYKSKDGPGVPSCFWFSENREP
jgi:hypothetical protein